MRATPVFLSGDLLQMIRTFVAKRWQLALCVSCALLALPVASAQTMQTQAGTESTKPDPDPDLRHYIHAIPKTPADYKSITAEGRFYWFVRSTIGFRSLAAG